MEISITMSLRISPEVINNGSKTENHSKNYKDKDQKKKELYE